MATLFQSATAGASLLHPPPPPSSSSSASPSHCADVCRLVRKSHLMLRMGGDVSTKMCSGLWLVKAQLNGNGTSTGVSKVAEVGEEDIEVTKPRKASPLQKGGTLMGNEAEGKDPSLATLRKTKSTVVESSGNFENPRWRNGTWDIQQFSKDGKVNWDAVIDAEVSRRKWLEENPEASSNSNPVVFDTSTIPWWAWVKRFHLPEAELLNGRAAMIGFVAGYFVDSLTGVGLVDQTNSFFGKLLLFIAVIGVLLIRKNEDVGNLKTVVNEWTFYDKQWQATWKDEEQSSATEELKKFSEKESDS